jgi:hypothetical protein
MAKKDERRWVTSITSFNSANISTLDDLISDLTKLRDENSNYERVSHSLEFEYDYWYDSPENFRLEITTGRLEAQEECQKRLELEERARKEANRVKNQRAKEAKAKREKDERELLQKLKLKYEK